MRRHPTPQILVAESKNSIHFSSVSQAPNRLRPNQRRRFNLQSQTHCLPPPLPNPLLLPHRPRERLLPRLLLHRPRFLLQIPLLPHPTPRRTYFSPVHQRRRPFDDGLFSDAFADGSIVSNHPKSRPFNGTIVILSKFSPDAGFSPNIVDDGVRYHEIARHGVVRFKIEDGILLLPEANGDGEEADKEETQGDGEFQFLIRGLGLPSFSW